MKTFPALRVEIADRICTITIHRPEALNAINQAVMQSLFDVFAYLKEDVDLRGVVITGAGEKAFAAGADIKGFRNYGHKQASELAAFGHKTYAQIEQFPSPVIAAVQGYALGGGCELALACHMRIAGEKAIFGQPEVNLGLIPGYGGSQRLTQLVGKGKALEWLLTGDMIPAKEAFRYGLVNEVVPVGEEVASAKKLLQSIASKAPIAVSHIIELVNLHFENVQEAYSEEINRFGACFETEDAKEGIDAFLNKRKADFKNK
jgi:enoyl-CoA hydratase